MQESQAAITEELHPDEADFMMDDVEVMMDGGEVTLVDEQGTSLQHPEQSDILAQPRAINKEKKASNMESSNAFDSLFAKTKTNRFNNNSSIASNHFGLSPSPEITLMDKKMKFYPDMAKFSKLDEQLFAFLKKDQGCPFKGKKINPDQMDYPSPDFGFDNFLTFEEAEI